MSNSILEVLNVGQRDCLILNPYECKYDDNILLVDTGPGNYDFTKCFSERNYNSIQLFITHHDNDHLGGFKFLLKPEIFNKVKTILN